MIFWEIIVHKKFPSTEGFQRYENHSLGDANSELFRDEETESLLKELLNPSEKEKLQDSLSPNFPNTYYMPI